MLSVIDVLKTLKSKLSVYKGNHEPKFLLAEIRFPENLTFPENFPKSVKTSWHVLEKKFLT